MSATAHRAMPAWDGNAARPAGPARGFSGVTAFPAQGSGPAVLTLDRVLEQVLGPGASARDPRANEAAAPWLTGLKLGSRIHLVLELLRLLLPGETTGARWRARRLPPVAARGGRARWTAQPLPGRRGESRRSASSSVWSSASSWLDPASELVRIARATSRSSKIRGSVTE